MYSDALAAAFEATVVLSTGAGVAAYAAGPLLARRARVESTRGRGRWRVALHPLAQLVFVCTLLFVNQVLFGAYVLRVHGGSSAFVARYISFGWFHIATEGSVGSLVRWVAAHAGDARWLSPTVLRVQAFLELPFTLFAYLAVARLLGATTYRALCRLPLLIGASLSFSFTFSLVEVSLSNPWTGDDLVLRALAAVTVPFYVAWIARLEACPAPEPDEHRDGPNGVLGLLAFLAGAGAISTLVLAVYDAFLLYNLSHLPSYATALELSLVVAIVASIAAPRIDRIVSRRSRRRSRPPRSPSSPSMDVSVSALRAFTILFFVPSLSLRYWGGHPSAVLAGLSLVVLALVAAASHAVARAGGARRLVTVVLSAVPALVAGAGAGAFAVASAGRVPVPELLLARGVLSFLAVAIVTFRVVEIAVCWGPHETKAQADEA